MTTALRETPNKSCAIYKAAAFIYSHGPQSRADLFVTVDFGTKCSRPGKINHAIEIGWLCGTPAGTIDVTESTRLHFAGLQPKESYVGKVAPPAYRGDVFATQSLSKKYIPNSRGPRLDVPAWSVRKTQPTPKEA